MTRIGSVTAGILLLAAAPAGAAETFVVGESCTVVVKAAPLQKGDQLVVRVPKGTRLTVERTRDDWVRTTYTAGGEKFEGWMESAFLAPAPKFDASKPARFPDAYGKFARVLSMTVLAPKPEKLGQQQPDFVQQIADLKEQISALKAALPGCGDDLKPLAAEVVAEYEWLAKLQRAIGEHPDFAGLPRDAVDQAGIKAGATPTPKVEVALERHELPPGESLVGLRARYLHCLDELRALGLRLPTVARPLAGPRVERGQALVADFTEPYPFESDQYFDLSAARGPFDDPDILRLTNVAGVTLTHCTVLVKVVGETETRSTVHYVARWADRDCLTARYYGGVRMGEKWVGRVTCAKVRRLEVSVWADELRQEQIPYDLDAREKEFGFREYVERATIVAACDRYAGVFGKGYRIGVSFKDVRYVPTAKLTVRVKRGGEWTERIDAVTRWKAGAVQAIDFPDANGTDTKPSDYEVVVEMTYRGWSHTRVFHWKPD